MEMRGSKYGRFLATLVNYVISTMPDSERYKITFKKEVNDFSFERRSEGAPHNSGCVLELEDLICLDVKNPKELARVVKEELRLMYQKNTAKRFMTLFWIAYSKVFKLFLVTNPVGL